MKFQFNVNLSEQDYLDYNMFWMIKSPYGKKQFITLRIISSIIICVIFFVILFWGGILDNVFIGISILIIFLILHQLFFKRFFLGTLKGQVKSLKKSGKMAYSESSVIEFYEDYFMEITHDNKVEQKYSVIERISLLDNKAIYIHINNVMAYIIPWTCFESAEQYDSFLEFIKTKCANIHTY